MIARFIGRHGPSVLLAGTGTTSFVAGLAQSPARGTFAGTLVVLGVGCMVLSAFAPRLKEWEIGLKGVKGKMELPAVEDSVELMSGQRPIGPEFFEGTELIAGARTALAGEAIAMLLQSAGAEALAECSLRLYLFDEDDQVLVPVVRAGDPTPSPLERFRPGCGATGTAFVRGERVFVAGPAVADATHGLTPEQQEHFRDLTAVTSLPISNAAGRVLGVLTAATTATEGPERLASEECYYEMLSRSLALARVLVDLLKWFDDGYDEG